MFFLIRNIKVMFILLMLFSLLQGCSSCSRTIDTLQTCADEHNACLSNCASGDISCIANCDIQRDTCVGSGPACSATLPASNALQVDLTQAEFDQLRATTKFDNLIQDFKIDPRFANDPRVMKEINAVLAEFNSIGGIDFQWTATPMTSIPNFATVFSTTNPISSITYADHVNDTGTHGCKGNAVPGQTVGCGSGPLPYTANSCKLKRNNSAGRLVWGGSGASTIETAITMNSNCYNHFRNPNANDHPRLPGLLHELSHSLGMVHAPDRADDVARATQWLTMCGANQIHPTAYDAAFLRSQYGISGHVMKHNYAASGRSTVASRNYDFNGENRKRNNNGDFNPLKIYIENNKINDCTTKAPVKFAMTWFNNSSSDDTRIANEVRCMHNTLGIRKRSNQVLLEVINRFEALPLTKDTEDSFNFTMTADMPKTAALSLPNTNEYEVFFEVNTWGKSDEHRRGDNVVTYPVEIYPSSRCN